jgi:4-hydroxythreonine-4-phosphate dehydrogenase
MTPASLPTVLTMGEPGGISGEVSLKAWHAAHHILQPYFVIDSAERLKKLSVSLNLNIDIVEISTPHEALTLFKKALPVFPIELADQVIPGELNSKNTPAVISAIEQAVELVQSGEAGAIVTNPIHKKALLIVETALIADAALRQDFGLAQPRLAIAALNPHAGEGGAMGEEEKTLIEPAIKELQSQGISVTGPHPPDTLFHEQARKLYDVALCMYHDQALIPIKTLDFDSAVNVTLGLPFIRTSPDHGTALDIAGTGQANEQSLVAALKLAGELAQNRAATRRP